MSETTAAPVTDKIETAPAVAPATTPAPAAPAAPATLATGVAQTTTPTPAAPSEWPSDWRQKLSAEDPDAIKTLERFGSPNDLAKAYRSLQAKMSSGDLKTKLPDNPTPEQLSEYRKSLGIPERYEDYKIELPNGVVFGENDKPLVDSFKSVAHASNMTTKDVNQLLGWYTDQQQIVAAQRADQDNANRAKSEEMLRREWGAEFRTANGEPGKNINAIGNLFADAPKGVFDKLLSARESDGSLLGDNPDVIRFLSKLGREMYPTATMLPMSADSARGVSDRKLEIESLMGDKKSDYWKGAKADSLQAEYREIIDSLERHKGRRAA